MGGTGSFEGIEGTVDVVTIAGSTGPIPLVESPSYDSTGLIPPFESPSYDSYMNKTVFVARNLCGITRKLNVADFMKKGITKGYNTIDWSIMNHIRDLGKLHIAQLNNEPVQLGFVTFGKTVLKIVVKSNIPLPVAP